MPLPSPASLVVLIRLAAFVALAYHLSLHRLPTFKGIGASILLMIGMLAFYEGFTLAAREESRGRYGRVVSGIVLEKYQSDGRGRTYATGGREGPRAGTSGFLVYEGIARLLAYGSARTRMIAYEYPCDVGRGRCLERDYVAPDLFARVAVGGLVNVRRSDDERLTARLDENPQWAIALWQMAIGALFLTGAGLLSGRLQLRRRERYRSSPAIVMAVEPVEYRDEKRWKVRFAYFDAHGNAQESADEVLQPTWKPGDDCVAVYRPGTPDLATLQPVRQPSI